MVILLVGFVRGTQATSGCLPPEVEQRVLILSSMHALLIILGQTVCLRGSVWMVDRVYKCHSTFARMWMDLANVGISPPTALADRPGQRYIAT